MAGPRLVTLGDSLTQGVMNAAAHDPSVAYPAIVARSLGLGGEEFRAASFFEFGGLPANLEYLLRKLEEEFGPDLSGREWVTAPFHLRSLLDDLEDHWERGAGTEPTADDVSFHNLASLGMTVDDALHLTADACAARLAESPSDNWFAQIPEHAFYRLALTMLNPAGRNEFGSRTVADRLQELSATGAIENVVVALGSNNALGTITQMEVRETDDRILADPLGQREAFNLWRPEHFTAVYEQLAARVEAVAPRHVFLATVPHVTIAPLARGVGTGLASRLDDDARYFRHYTYYWIPDEAFDPELHPYLSGEQARNIDSTIDQYNEAIRTAAAARRDRGLSWHVWDLSAALDRMAYRRFREVDREPPGGRYVFPVGWNEALARREWSELTTEFYSLEDNRRVRGGIFSLDGLHPTTMAQGLLAHELLQMMWSASGPPTGSAAPSIDFEHLASADTLLNSPPGLLDDTLATLQWLERWIGLTGLVRRLS